MGSALSSCKATFINITAMAPYVHGDWEQLPVKDSGDLCSQF